MAVRLVARFLNLDEEVGEGVNLMSWGGRTWH